MPVAADDTICGERSTSRFRSLVVLITAALMLTFATCAHGADEIYFVNGRQVSGVKYEAYRLTQAAMEAMRENHVERAVGDLQRALKVDPTLAEAHTMMGLAMARKGQTSAAEEQFQMAMVSDPTSSIPPLNLASLYQTNGRLTDALQLYRKYLQNNPQSPQADAINERIKLLDAEVKRENKARAADDNRYDTTSYLGNVIHGGAKRWTDAAMPLKIYISPGDGLKNYRPEYETILQQSFHEWERASHGKVSIRFCGSPEDANIVCEWTDDPQQLESSAEGGETQVHCVGNAICKAKLMLSVIDSNALFPLSKNLVRLLCLHEVGHSLGLLGHSANPADVMFCTAPVIDREQHLTLRDSATLNQLYDIQMDQISQVLAYLEHETNGNAFNVIRLALIMLSAIIASGLFLGAVLKAARKGKKKGAAAKKTAV